MCKKLKKKPQTDKKQNKKNLALLKKYKYEGKIYVIPSTVGIK